MAIIGIDLGTTNSLAAQLDNVGRPRIVHNSEGANLTPSVVQFLSRSKVIVGEFAKKELGLEKNVFSEFKRDMGTSVTYSCGSEALTPVDLSCFVLQKIKQDCEAAVGLVDTVVITVPANFRNEAREATLSAAIAAGFKTDMLLNEPTAAALYYANQAGKKLNGIYVVYDLGGGTLDVSIIKAQGDDVEVLASDGLQKLGGKDFDQKIIDLVAKKFKAELGKEFNTENFNFTKNDAEEKKKELSTREETKVRVTGQGILPTTLIITRKEFEESISGYIAQTEMLCESVMLEANISLSDVDDVFLAGGSSRIPLVKKTLAKLFGKEPVVSGNPDEAIALGAAIYAGYKTDKSRLNPLQRDAVSEMRFQEVSPAFFGTLVRCTEQNARGSFALKNTIIISKNQKIPCSVVENFYTINDNQTTVDCTITQSPNNESDPRFVRKSWDGELALPPNRPSGQEIQVTYSYLENGTMHAEFVDVQSKKSAQVDIASQSIGGGATININDFIVE